MMKPTESEFERMVRDNRSTIYSVCYMFSSNQDEVADLFQEVLIQLWRSFPSFEGRSRVSSWIYRVALNTCVSLDRKQRRRGMKTVPLSMDVNPYESDESNYRQMESLRRRIAQLGPFDRAIVLLWLENMSYEEIGAIVGITAKNVSVRLFRIKEQLKRMKDE